MSKEDDLHEETLRERIVDTWVNAYKAKEERYKNSKVGK